MHLESPFCAMQSETFVTDVGCEFASPTSLRRESCDSVSLEQFAFTPPQHDTYYPSYQEKSSLMSATTAISGALEELQSESYLPTDEWSQTLETFLTSLQQPDAIPELFTSDLRHTPDTCQYRNRLPFGGVTDLKDNISQIEDIDNYLSPPRAPVSPMTISSREMSFIDDKCHQYDEDAFEYKQLSSPKVANHFNFYNCNTQKCLHALQEMSSPSFTLTSNLPENKPEPVADEFIMESVTENSENEATFYNMADEPSFTTVYNSRPEVDNVHPGASQVETKDEEKAEPEEIDGPRVCRWVDCNNTFSNRESLSRHIERSHVDQRKGDDYTCFWAACQRRYRPFNARYKLLIHMRVHSGEKPNKCTYKGCTKAFSRLENLKIHMRSHTGERPYICVYPRCGKAFSNSSDRAKHQRTHINAKPYVCSVPGCKKCYTDPSSLRKHVKNHTSKEQALAKRKAGDNYLTYSANYTSPTYNSSDCDATLSSIKNETEARIFPKFSKRRCAFQSPVSRPGQETFSGVAAAHDDSTPVHPGGVGHLGEHLSHFPSPPPSPRGSPVPFGGIIGCPIPQGYQGQHTPANIGDHISTNVSHTEVPFALNNYSQWDAGDDGRNIINSLSSLSEQKSDEELYCDTENTDVYLGYTNWNDFRNSYGDNF